MNRRFLLVIITLSLFAALSGRCLADWGWLVDIMPGAVLASFDSDEFHVRGQGEEEETSLICAIPSIGGGVRYERPSGYLALKGAGGLLLNTRLRAYTLQGVAELMFEIKESAMLGPHVGVGYCFDPDWWGDADVQLDETGMFMGGIQLTMGDRVSYVFSADYFSTVFDVDSVGAGWVANDDEIDLSGFAVQFGLRLTF